MSLPSKTTQDLIKYVNSIQNRSINNLLPRFPVSDQVNFVDFKLMFFRGREQNEQGFRTHYLSYSWAHWIYCLTKCLRSEIYFRGTPHKIKSFGLSCINVSFRAHPLSLSLKIKWIRGVQWRWSLLKTSQNGLKCHTHKRKPTKQTKMICRASSA